MMTDDVDLAAIRRRVVLVGRLSDGLLTVGPFSIGLDGVLSWIPGLGEIYSAGAAVFLLSQGYRAGVPTATLVLAGLLMGGRTLISAVPGAGPAIADVFTMHKMAAGLIVAAIDKRLAQDGAQGARPAKGAPRARQPLWRTRRPHPATV